MNVITRMLHLREMSVGKLSRLSKVGRSQLNLMLTGKRPGMHTWKHVDPFLQPSERDVLRRTTSYSQWEGRKSTGFHVEQLKQNLPVMTNGEDGFEGVET